jgi:hypothetical protein
VRSGLGLGLALQKKSCSIEIERENGVDKNHPPPLCPRHKNKLIMTRDSFSHWGTTGRLALKCRRKRCIRVSPVCANIANISNMSNIWAKMSEICSARFAQILLIFGNLKYEQYLEMIAERRSILQEKYHTYNLR